MTEREAFEQLEDSELVTYAQASLDYCKDMLNKCLKADIPAMITKPEDSERVHLLIREQDVEQVSTMFDAEWRELAEQEGSFQADDAQKIDEDFEGDLPCPACGHVAPLVEGACADCGLVLE